MANEELTEFDKEYIKFSKSLLYAMKYFFINDASTNKDGTVKGHIRPIYWKHIVEMAKLVDEHRYIIVLKGKQIGISYFLSFLCLWKALTIKSFRCVICSSTGATAKELLDKVLFAYDLLPDWLKLPTITRSGTEIEFGTTLPDGKTIPFSSIQTITSAPNASVGKTVSLAIIDEHDFHPYPSEDWAAVEAAASGGGQILCVSTWNKPAGSNTKFKELWREAVAGENNFFPVFFSYAVREDRDDEWYATEERNYKGDIDQFYANNPRSIEEATSPLASKSFFNKDKMLQLLNDSKKPYNMKGSPDYFNFYFTHQPVYVYLICADCSTGLNKDYQAAWVLQKRGGLIEDAAILHANDLSPKTYAYQLNEMGRIYNFPLLVIETNHVGSSVFQELVELNYPNLYYRDRERTKFGWYTSDRGSGSRDIMLVELNQALADGIIIIKYKEAIDQLLEFMKLESRSGSVKIKSTGKHDDLVTSLAIGFQIMKSMDAARIVKNNDYTILRHVVTGGMYAD